MAEGALARTRDHCDQALAGSAGPRIDACVNAAARSALSAGDTTPLASGRR